ncbi:MAG: hypothetical protein KJ970_08655 [Candidatus Eisenbacteria bacterium]|uniref:Uncharacterized protein n=1 Tax=Eiseniibacteriota bacterium TaxID=2212470 RepID=A0A948W6U1_UNCEI|nr:hypothetical protein [Candidatus Eisenbacteria bacterium]MBU1948676.1 hypothetical protein [Candidatus Eisenbacteria bacterium]MBU2690986.1 hypothetical protein [Candidatus Eisenbacteria bacterium]
MPDDMKTELLDDMNITHAFLNALCANYQGEYVFNNVLGQLTQSPECDERLAKTAKILDMINEWWDQFRNYDPIIHFAESPGRSGDAALAWELLSSAMKRQSMLIETLLKNMDVESLMQDLDACHLRVAAHCDASYGREHYVNGLITYGEVMNRPEVCDRWRQKILSCRNEISQSTGLFEAVRQMGTTMQEGTIAELQDQTLMLPVVFGQRCVDIRQLFGMYTGHFNFMDAGIPPDDVQYWSEAGFEPYQAGQWFAAGMTVGESIDWIQAGVPDPLGAAGFKWRGIDREIASPWYRSGYGGRIARAWRARGVEFPEQFPQEEVG